MMDSRILLTIKLFAMILVSCSAIAGNMISIGYEQTSGNYGLENDTDITTIPLSIQSTTDIWRFKVTVPYISVTGDGSVIPGSNGVMRGMTRGGSSMGPPPVTTATAVVTQSGLGDITTSVSHALFPKRNSYIFYEITGEIKWGTASEEKNLGTGENDFSISLYSVYERYPLQPSLTVGYLVIGDTSFVDYNDVLFTTAGLTYLIDPQTSFGAAYDYRQATTNGADNNTMIRLYASRSFNYEWSANVYVLKGFTDSVANSGVGFTLMHSY